MSKKINDDAKVTCRKCGKTKTVSMAACIGSGWPLCCGETMMLESKTGKVVKGKFVHTFLPPKKHGST